MTEEWAKWEQQVVNGVFPLHRCVSCSDHSAVFLTEHAAKNHPTALLKLVPAIPTLRDTQLAHWTAAATLAHPNLIPLLEAGRCELGGLQFLFVVMEYAQATLAEILTQHALAPEALRKGLRPILVSLAYVHRRQLVQGSLKPANILLVNRQVKLASDTVRPTGESAGSVARHSVYDPPESRDGSFSSAGDIWSLGVLMVEALTQRQPIWPDKSSITPDLPTALPAPFGQLVRQCLNRNPDRRPSAAELAFEINPVRVATVSYPVLFPPESPETASPPPVREEVAAAPRARPLPRRRRFFRAAAAILVVSVGAWAGLRLPASQQAPALVAAISRDAASAFHDAISRGAAAAVAAVGSQRPASALQAASSQRPSITLAGGTSRDATTAAPEGTLRDPAAAVPAMSRGPATALPAGMSQDAATAVAAVGSQGPASALPPASSQAPATTLPAATADGPATAMSARSQVPTVAATSTAEDDPDFAGSQAMITPPSVLHEESPDVPPGALETIRGHIKFAVRVRVDRSGNVVHATVINHSPSRYFSRLAIETARKWKFVAADNQDSRHWLLRFEFTRDGATTHAANPRGSRTDTAYRPTGAANVQPPREEVAMSRNDGFVE